MASRSDNVNQSKEGIILAEGSRAGTERSIYFKEWYHKSTEHAAKVPAGNAIILWVISSARDTPTTASLHASTGLIKTSVA